MQEDPWRTEQPCGEPEQLTCAQRPTHCVHTAVPEWGVINYQGKVTVGVVVGPGAQAPGLCGGKGLDVESGWG